ncbi:RNA polymerase sigma factor [Sphingomonas sp. ID1715]|uniref:RNA polymerase sigma factor n=1 Tax=Sphingomonas sp. ID1715 TaxID=1656898 RepID=UPI001C2B9F87|nr:sigma-70 family RNA polymerase sigma factor [Sphingomonas sp. ID1715]
MSSGRLLKRAEDEEDTAHSVGLDLLYRQEASRLRRILRRRVGNDEACDLVQESFLRLAGRCQSGDPIENQTGYLRRIASNLLRNPSRVAAENRRAATTEYDEQLHPGPDPVGMFEARDLLERLDRSVAKLKPKTRDIFLAHRVEGLTYAQIAERTGLSVKGVEKQMSKALAELDRLIHR